LNTFLLMILQIAQFLLWLLWIVIIAQAIFSWLLAFNVINLYNDFVRAVWNALERITGPIYRPIRRLMPDFGALDLTPLVVIILIYIVDRFVLSTLIAQLAATTY
jgi:YggT family protein